MLRRKELFPARPSPSMLCHPTPLLHSFESLRLRFIPRSQQILVISERHVGWIFVLSFVNRCNIGRGCKPRKDAIISKVDGEIFERGSIFETILGLESKLLLRLEVRDGAFIEFDVLFASWSMILVIGIR